MKQNWIVRSADENNINEFSQKLKINKYIAEILLNRGITDIAEANEFINPRLSCLHSPFLMKGMYDAVTRIRHAIANNEKIGIFADSDLDGLTSLTVLLRLLEKIGNVTYYRFAVDDEEYGLRDDVIEEMFDRNIDLLITLDSGIRDIKEIEYAVRLGIDVIVCDHHEQGEEVPQAVIINPKMRDCSYPFKELAGVGVTFKFCHAILMSYLQSFNKLFILICEENYKIYLSHIKNGIILKTDIFNNFTELNFLNNEVDENTNIVLFDIEYLEQLQAIIDHKQIYDFKFLLNIISDNKITNATSINDLCRIFSINTDIITDKYKIINYIFSEIEYNHSGKITEFLNSVIDLVSIGTLADIMPVYGENRTIIHYGIESLNSTSHPGLSLLVEKQSGRMTSKSISWDISPLLNTPGRFGKTNLIADFFLEKDIDNLKSVITEISRLNSKRKNMISDLFAVLMSEIKNNGDTADNLIFISTEKVPEGLCGLLANRIADAADRPVIIVSLFSNKEIVKGSGRTMKNINFFSFVECHSGLFEKIGGHKQAFGFTINRNKIEELKKKITESVNHAGCEKFEYSIDLEIPIEDINIDFIKRLNLLEPYGHKNRECLFLSRNVPVKSFKRFGKNSNHGKYTFHNNNTVEAVGWDIGDLMEKYSKKDKLDLIFKLENNYFNGYIIPRMLIIDLD
ncbi:MAG: single-stranded-DNA-specific exonuclease RecJ [Spirochaetes bacterium]|nr:single-stranded-DNA-specific exonuclease RecJ [Spirochaetota bacterium]